MDNNNSEKRKNKTGQKLQISNHIFTVEDLHQQNPDYCNITLRVHLKEAIKNGKVIELGYINTGKGRPKSVMSPLPVTQELLKEAEERRVLLKKDLIINVSSTDNTVEVIQQKEQPKVITREDIINRVNKILA